MKLFESTQKKVHEIQKFVREGGLAFLDFRPFFPRFSEHVPGFVKSDYVLITASSGVGKSKFTRFLVRKILESSAKIPKLKVKVFLNSTEESKEKVISSFIIPYLYSKYKVKISYRQLFYPRKEELLDERLQALVDEGFEFYKPIEENLEIMNLNNPLAFYLTVRDYMFTIGKFYEKNQLVEKGEKWDRFEYDDPNQFVIAVSDNLNNYSAIQGKTWYDSIREFSLSHCRLKLNLVCGCIVINVHQQASAKEAIETNFRGDTIEKKLEPSLEGLGDIKIIQRDCTIALGLFEPNRYNIPLHVGWDITKIASYYRSLHILKNREGYPNKILPMLTDLFRDYFTELPAEESKKQEVYKLVEKWKNRP